MPKKSSKVYVKSRNSGNILVIGTVELKPIPGIHTVRDNNPSNTTMYTQLGIIYSR